MTFQLMGRKTLFALVLALATIPAIALAQSYQCGSLTNYSCTPGILHVYVVVNNGSQYGQQYGQYQYGQYGQFRAPSDFTVVVNTQNNAANTYRASSNGLNVSIVGSYTVEAQFMQGFTPSYSAGCTGSMSNNNQQSCVITENANGYYNDGAQYNQYQYSDQNPYQYQYPSYQAQPLSCSPSYQTVALGQSITFMAVGGFAPYTWVTPHRTYSNIGSIFTTVPQTPGVQTVQVGSGSQSAVCTVNVLSNGVTTTWGQTVVPAYTAPASAVLTATYVPALPNTGFEPVSATRVAVALVIVFALGLFLTPYVRKTIATIV